jgi:hypothetical protein
MKLLISIILATTLIAAGEGPTVKKIAISGNVVARDVLTPLGNIAYHNMSSEVFIVRVEKPKGLSERSRYIKVHYGRWMDDPHLPANFFASSKVWRLKVSRSPDCDGTLKKMATVYNKDTNEPQFWKEALPKRTPGFESEPIPLEEVLPCYELSPKDMESLKN